MRLLRRKVFVVLAKVHSYLKKHGVNFITPKECKACDKVFPSESKLKIHLRRDHLMEREFKCNECDATFLAKNTLEQHMVKHTGVKKFRCQICDKAYALSKYLREHMRIHENDRRFRC